MNMTQAVQPPLAQRNLRQRDIVPPEKLATCNITIIGVGAIGRQVALQLAAMGAPLLQLFDFDTVEEVNLGAQGYFPSDLGMEKVHATADLVNQINPEVKVTPVAERFRRSTRDVGDVIFCCVDSIETRKLIWESVGQGAKFFCDGRMSAETMRIITVTDHASRKHYPTTLFAASEASAGACTAKSTIYCANIAAGMMIAGFTQWLRGIPVNVDVSFNLLAMEAAVHPL